MVRNKKAASVAAILAAAAGWGIIGVFSRPLAAAGLNPVQITFIRCVIAAVGMGAFLLIRERALFCVKLKDLWMFLGTGLLSIVFFNVCYFITISHATLAAASILLYTAPCFVMLMSACFFREKVTAAKAVSLVFAFAGCMLASGFAGGAISAFAFMTGIGSGFGYALYSIFGKVALKKYHAFTVIFYTFAIASAGLAPFSNISGIVKIASDSPKVLPIAAGLGLISTLAPFILYTCGLRHVEAGKAAVLAFAEPMVACIAGAAIFKEELSVKNAAGILLIFFAIVLLNVPAGKMRRQAVVSSSV